MSALSVVVVLIAAQALGMTGTIWALAAVVVSTLALSSIMGLRTAPHTSPGEPKTPSLERWGWLRTGTVIVASNVATVLTTQLDLLVIAIVATPLETGIYAAASRIALLITLALGGLVIREGPVFGRLLAAAQVAACWKEYRRACAVSGGIGIVTFALILGAGGIALSLYGPQFSQGWTWLWVLAIGRCVSAVTGPAAVLLIVMGNERSAAGAAWLGLSVGAGTMAVLGGPFGPLGIAIGASSGMAVQNITQAYLARKQIRNLGLGAANC
jgi:O-antigen/teichoic acid export membrane protein